MWWEILRFFTILDTDDAHAMIIGESCLLHGSDPRSDINRHGRKALRSDISRHGRKALRSDISRHRRKAFRVTFDDAYKRDFTSFVDMRDLNLVFVLLFFFFGCNEKL